MQNLQVRLVQVVAMRTRALDRGRRLGCSWARIAISSRANMGRSLSAPPRAVP